MARRVLRFRVGERRWALPLEAVREILEAPALLRVPRTRTGVAGVVLRRGVLVPVYDLAPAAPASQVLVLEWGDMLNGLRVSHLEAQLALSEEAQQDPAPPASGHLTFKDGSAERIDLDQLYHMLGIPI
jgi:chemotaxis signal transduction protein